MTLISSALNTSSTTSVDLNLGTFLAFHEKKSNEFVSFLAAGCAGCDKEITDGQALIALDKQWHVWCFKCTSSGVLLHGEYMGRYVDDLLVLHVLVLISLSLCRRDGLPYSVKEYQRQFGVKCGHCGRYISGKVLQVRLSSTCFVEWFVC